MSKRSSMLSSVIRDIISPALRECPQECGVVTITEIEVSDDFSHATVYISALLESDLALKFLKGKEKVLQRKMSSLNRKRIPILRFRLDHNSERGQRIDELLGGVE